MSWIDVATRLSRTSPTEVEHARALLRDLARPARALHAGPSPCGRPGHRGCPFARHEHGDDVCRAVPQLAGVDVAAPGRDDDPVAALLAALPDTGEAVRWCRTTAHPQGDCWFRAVPGRDCGDLLRLALVLG